MVIVQQFCLPIKCNHETPYYDELRGEMICTQCGEVLIDREPTNNNWENYNKKIVQTYEIPKRPRNLNLNVKELENYRKIDRLNQRNILYITRTIFTKSVQKIYLFSRYFEINEFVIEDLLYYYSKIPKALICKKFTKGVEKYRCYEHLFVLFFYQEGNKHLSLEAYIQAITDEGYILRMDRFNKIVVLLKQQSPELIRNLINNIQYDRSKSLNRRVLKSLEEIVNQLDYTHVKGSKNLIPIMMRDMTIDTNVSEIENFRNYLIKRSNQIISKINFSNVKMHLNSICSGLIYIACRGSITKKSIKDLCHLSELTVSLTTHKFEDFIKRKCPSLL